MMESEKTSIFDQDLEDFQAILHTWHQPSYRAQQIWQGLYRSLWPGLEQFSNLPLDLRKELQNTYHIAMLTPVQVLRSTDGETTKTLFRLKDGHFIETILMKYRQRRTLCISTQAGCALGCVFCATGQGGFSRNLTSGEIVEQVIVHARELSKNNDKLTNIVLMGMGEPFLNYDAVMQAINRLNHHAGFDFGERRFTISTAGIVPMIKHFAAEARQVNLAISLHAAQDELRSSLMPINRKYSLGELIPACRSYVDKTHRRLTFEWALIDGVNDREEDARDLVRLINGMICHVNLIPLNPTTQYPASNSQPARIQAFKEALGKAGIPCTVRLRRGIDVSAGCGQLAGAFWQVNHIVRNE
jgi:23S rRNA (adenine2503-C2)-methyltransferase